MSSNRSKGIVGVFLAVGFLFFIFIIFAFYTAMNLKDAAKIGGENLLSGDKAQIAVVEVEGVIMSSKKVIKKLIMAEENKKYKAIIVRVNSPGGAVGPTQEIYEEMRRIDKQKPVYASFGTVAASGGYYIGAAARKIFSPAGSMTGSIGVIMNFMNLSKLYEWAKVSPNIVKAGKYKDIGSAARDMTDEERALLNDMTTKVHEQFIQDIYAVRKDKIKGGLDGLRQYAQGQIFSGGEAKELGLVDELSGLWQAGRSVHKELKLDGKFAMKFIKLKRDITIDDILGGIEESVKDIQYNVYYKALPMFMSRI